VGPSIKLTTFLHIVQRLSMHGVLLVHCLCTYKARCSDTRMLGSELCLHLYYNLVLLLPCSRAHCPFSCPTSNFESFGMQRMWRHHVMSYNSCIDPLPFWLMSPGMAYNSHRRHENCIQSFYIEKREGKRSLGEICARV
jgi:hypothetical protein